ncbi:Ger(x)C family spore germination protein [Cohnella sp. GCM10027633]|uniref:Ger(x)C family spore germination protein n=1 Tax=unclassified Cohnella TaxID=2636738 RepID=UPI0036377000
MDRQSGLGFRWARLCMAIAICTSLTGCWSKEELNDRTFIATLLVDRTDEGETEISALFMLPNRISAGLAPTPSEKPYTVVTSKGRDVAEAIQNIQDDLPRSVNWGQMRVIIVGDKFARAGMDALFDHLVRAPDFRLRVFVFYYNGLAKNLAKLETVFERTPAEIWREAAHIKRVPPVTIRDLLYSYWNNLGDGYLPELDMRTLKPPSEDKPIKWSGIGGAALMKDAKVVGRFEADEMKGILLLEDRVREMIVTTDLPDGGLLSARLFDVKPYTTSYRQGGSVRIRVSIDATADLMSIQSGYDLKDPKNIAKLEQALDMRLRELAESAIERADSHRADVFQWSEFVKYKYPALWKEWTPRLRENLAMNLEAEIVPRVHLRSTGVNRSSKQ